VSSRDSFCHLACLSQEFEPKETWLERLLDWNQKKFVSSRLNTMRYFLMSLCKQFDRITNRFVSIQSRRGTGKDGDGAAGFGEETTKRQIENRKKQLAHTMVNQLL